jgi:hypothetical protein
MDAALLSWKCFHRQILASIRVNSEIKFPADSAIASREPDDAPEVTAWQRNFRRSSPSPSLEQAGTNCRGAERWLWLFASLQLNH